MKKLVALACALAPLLLSPTGATAQERHTYTRADTLRGSIGPARAWWDVSFYDLHVRVNPKDSSISGVNRITFRMLELRSEMQLDLQQPMVMDSVVWGAHRALTMRRDGNAYFVSFPTEVSRSKTDSVIAYFHGKPRAAQRAPWDGGFVWARDSLGSRWIATANQGLGASVWWPNKDTQADEPDSQRVAITVPDSIIDVSNGRLRSVTSNGDGTTTWEWFVTNPINNYDVAVNAAKYAHLGGVYYGEQGPLTLDFYPLAYHADTARVQFEQVRPMLACFEHWFGPYPWYEDGYKLVETPHLGMEHQSAVAYGNHYQNGYLGRDLSGTGLGLKWDFIIVHESAHEWFGNSLTSKDLADMWVHESFANYSEALFTECQQGKEAGASYVIGTRRLVRNDEPIVAPFGVNAEGSGDMYYKGGNMLHTMRQLVNDDEKWRSILRGLQATYRHQVVTGQQVEEYISQHAGMDLSKVFAQYLTTTKIPVLEYRVNGTTLSYRWSDVVPGFDMPVRVTVGNETKLLRPSESWQTTAVPAGATLTVDRNFYVTARRGR
ncbi:MAG TPA: M1 family metallopeptidase [Gemmatimonadaceae bacterium]